MKIIHCADIHLGSSLRSQLGELAPERRKELLASFRSMVAYAEKNGINAILLAGDVFDGDRPAKLDKEFFYGVVKNNPDIDFFYLRGNHDTDESYTQKLGNLKTFGENWVKYSLDDTDIYGIEINENNASSLYPSLAPDRERRNIVMLHGQTAQTKGAGLIDLSALRGKNIDYLALGHIHKYSAGRLDERGSYAYSGCLEGRGFDEIGEKGFIVLDTDYFSHEFIPFSKRVIHEFEVDVSRSENPSHAAKLAEQALDCKADDIARAVLVGEIGYDNDTLADTVRAYLANKCWFAAVKDKTEPKLDISKYKNSISLKGEFVRSVLAGAEDEAEKKRIIAAGLRILEGRVPEL
ncbi:MAG: metallophosphoesterase [Firmicutes bacterium]|nr:metallophosphoesterase [Bacillota bacterium]MBQ9604449.1 metallophosphoesterase [Bacillota bacterium]